jgi:hypothetical protein
MNSFLEEPPTITIRGESVRLRPYAVAFETRVFPVLREIIGDQGDAAFGTAAILAYAVFQSLPIDKAAAMAKDKAAMESAIQAAEWELSGDDFQAINSYVGGIMERHREAQVTVDSSPGKQPTGETPQTT